MKYKVVTNDSFEKYVDYIGRRRGRKFEDRFDSLDLDDVTADINVPSEGEINDAVRELDILDDVAIKSGAQDVEVSGDGRLRLLDFDEPKKSKKSPIKGDARAAGLDYDEAPDRRSTKQSDKEDDKVRELDFDEKGAEVKQKKSNVGSRGILDYDDDVDVSQIAASIADVYTALTSSDPKVVKAMIKRYAVDINDEKKIKDVMLAHAVQLNYDSLRVMCGDMKVVLTAKEKNLGFIDRNDIKDVLQKFRVYASSLSGANNTYGLIPNAIVSCGQEDQITCVNIIDFLTSWCELPIMPIYFRGAMTRKLYHLADYLLDELPNYALDVGLLAGPKGLLTRIKNFDDIPKPLLTKIMKLVLSKESVKVLPSRVIGGMLIICLKNGLTAQVIKLIDFESNKGSMILDYIEDEDAVAWEIIKKKLKLDR